MTEDNCPEFTVKATDKLACATIQIWLVMARANKVNPEKIKSAETVLRSAREWQKLNQHKVKIPD